MGMGKAGTGWMSIGPDSTVQNTFLSYTHTPAICLAAAACKWNIAEGDKGRQSIVFS